MIFNHIPTQLTELNTVTDDGKRLYQTPDGELFPSVTTVMSIYNKEAILEWRKRVGSEEANRISSRAARRGTKLHTVCESYLKNVSVEKIMPDTLALFRSIQPIIDKYVNNIHAIEAPLYSKHLKVGGRVDCVAEFDGKPAIIDFKTSSRIKTEDEIQNYFMQCAAYAVMFEERTKIPIPRIAIVMAVENQMPLVFVKKRDAYIDSFIRLRLQYENAQHK